MSESHAVYAPNSGDPVVEPNEKLNTVQREWIRKHEADLVRYVRAMKYQNVTAICELFDAVIMGASDA